MTAPPPPIAARLQTIARTLDDQFLGKSEVIRWMLVATIAGEHMLIIGPPGTAKSAIIRAFSKMIDARYFEYLLTRFTEPNEVFGPIDIAAFREGRYERRIEGMLPTAEIAFLDEVFKANSAILNSLLGVLNERQYTSGASVHRVPLLAAFGASNEVPADDELGAVFDRFLLRVRSDSLDTYQFHELLRRGARLESAKISGERLAPTAAGLTAEDLRTAQREVARRLELPDPFLATYRSLVFQLRAEGITISDRRAVKLLKLFAASAYVDGRSAPDERDFAVLRHTWNNADQSEILDAIVLPVVQEFERTHPEARRRTSVGVAMPELLAELQRIRDLLLGDRPLSDVQLFSQLRALNELKTAFDLLGTDAAREASNRVEQLLGHAVQTGKFAP